MKYYTDDTTEKGYEKKKRKILNEESEQTSSEQASKLASKVAYKSTHKTLQALFGSHSKSKGKLPAFSPSGLMEERKKNRSKKSLKRNKTMTIDKTSSDLQPVYLGSTSKLPKSNAVLNAE